MEATRLPIAGCFVVFDKSMINLILGERVTTLLVWQDYSAKQIDRVDKIVRMFIVTNYMYFDSCTLI